MARKARKKKSSRSTRKPLRSRFAGLGRINWPATRRSAAVAAWILALAAIIAGWGLGVPRLRQSIAAETGGEGQTAIEFVDMPTWVNGDLAAMLTLSARGRLGDDPFRQEDLVLVRDALLNTGWFESIEQVRRVRADLVRVRGTFVRPFAVIRDADGDHLVDPYGRLLPRSYPPGEAERFIVITGAHFDRPQRPAVQWDGADVTAALRLLRLIDSEPWAEQIEAIEAGEYFDRDEGGGLVIVTDRASRIVWGSAPGEETAGEADAGRKLSYLDYQAEHQGHIDGGYEGELDITSPHGVFAR
ncbi:MAG: hypothetical protein SYC29_05585 [Planctomycetota bacterium]|nr:hypothetical protein [Planctomycetota bacterium]